MSSEALRLADWLQGAVATYPQVSECEPGGYCSELDQRIDEAVALLRTQAARIAELEAENDKLRDGLAKGLSEKTMLTELAVRDGGLYAGIEGGAAAVLAAAFAEQFTEAGGINYVEVSFTHPKTGPLTVTLQRCQGKTPHQLRRDAESERDQLRAEVERLRKPLTDEQIQSIADDGHRNAAGGIYAASILPFAREIERQRGAQHVDT